MLGDGGLDRHMKAHRTTLQQGVVGTLENYGVGLARYRRGDYQLTFPSPLELYVSGELLVFAWTARNRALHPLPRAFLKSRIITAQPISFFI